MGDKSKIEWTDASWNPTTGCSRVSEGCRNCYAINTANRLSNIELTREAYEGTVRTLSDGSHDWTGTLNVLEDRLDIPLKWKRPRRVFVNSMSDLFHEKVPFDFIDKVFSVMALSQRHVFQVLTKRPERMRQYLLDGFREGCATIHVEPQTLNNAFGNGEPNIFGHEMFPWPLPNVWLGVSCENQKTADERIPLLLETPAAVRWISAEPLLGPISLTPGLVNYLRGSRPEHDPSCDGSCVNCPIEVQTNKLDWVVVGGESGHGARPMHPDWARSLRDQCADAGVPFFFKQWGSWSPITTSDGRQILPFADYNVESKFGFKKVDKHTAGHLLDGVEHFNYPEVKV